MPATASNVRPARRCWWLLDGAGAGAPAKQPASCSVLRERGRGGRAHLFQEIALSLSLSRVYSLCKSGAPSIHRQSYIEVHEGPL
jgi:hypothetical protein